MRARDGRKLFCREEQPGTRSRRLSSPVGPAAALCTAGAGSPFSVPLGSVRHTGVVSRTPVIVTRVRLGTVGRTRTGRRRRRCHPLARAAPPLLPVRVGPREPENYTGTRVILSQVTNDPGVTPTSASGPPERPADEHAFGAPITGRERPDGASVLLVRTRHGLGSPIRDGYRVDGPGGLPRSFAVQKRAAGRWSHSR